MMCLFQFQVNSRAKQKAAGACGSRAGRCSRRESSCDQEPLRGRDPREHAAQSSLRSRGVSGWETAEGAARPGALLSLLDGALAEAGGAGGPGDAGSEERTAEGGQTLKRHGTLAVRAAGLTRTDPRPRPEASDLTRGQGEAGAGGASPRFRERPEAMTPRAASCRREHTGGPTGLTRFPAF